jgi:transcriptional regulator with XRE-family HTH domain
MLAGPTPELLMARTIVLSQLVDEIETAVEERGLSYNQAARQIGVSPQRLSQWRRGGRVEWTAQLQRQLAGFLRVSPVEVLKMDGLDVSTEPVDPANLDLVAGPNPGSVSGLIYRRSSGRFRFCAGRTRFVRPSRPAYLAAAGDRPWVTGATCQHSETSCVARV